MNANIVMLDAFMLAELHRLGLLGDGQRFGHRYLTTRLACDEASRQVNHPIGNHYQLDFQEAPLSATIQHRNKLGCLLHEASVVAAFALLANAQLAAKFPKGASGVAWLLAEYDRAHRFPPHILATLKIRWSVVCALPPSVLADVGVKAG